MNTIHSFPDTASEKRFIKIYTQHHYKSEPLNSFLKRADVEHSKLSKYNFPLFVDPNFHISEFIAKYVVYQIKGPVKGLEKGKIDPFSLIRKFSKDEVTKAEIFLSCGINWRKEELDSYIHLIDTILCFKSPSKLYKNVLKSISTCPQGMVYSLDVGININEGVPVKHSNSIIPVVSENTVLYLYYFELLFGLDNSEVLFDWINNDFIKDKGLKYLCIDNGVFVSQIKGEAYPTFDKKTRLCSSNKVIIKYSSKVVERYKSQMNFISIGEKEDKIEEKGKRKAIPKPVRNQVWKNHFGDKLKGKCYCCKTKLGALESWEAGHIVAHTNGGPDIAENLRPICGTCNKSMGSMNMDDFYKRYFSK